jgi:hypothetical protein
MPGYAVAITFPQNSTAYEALSKETFQQRVDVLKAKFRKQ